VSDELRFSKIDDAIQRLAAVSADLSKMLAVHEHRLTQQEKSTDHISYLIEKRREDLESKLKEVYETMKEEDGAILEEIKKSRDASDAHHERLEVKVTKLERLALLVTGSALTVGFIIGMVEKYFKIFS
jgi:flagellar motility protein MotE (MotC chaperone)